MISQATRRKGILEFVLQSEMKIIWMVFHSVYSASTRIENAQTERRIFAFWIIE